MIYCQACGHKMHEAAVACPSCGRPNTTLAQPMTESGGWLSFQGRIPRKVYWLHYWLPLAALGFVAGVADVALQANGIVTAVFTLLTLVPSLAASVKRLHDRDHSGWFILIGLIPLLGALWLFVELSFVRGTRGTNRFGADPARAGSYTAVGGTATV